MRRRRISIALVLAASAAASGCGSQGIELSKSDPDYAGALLFQQRCAGCHSFKYAGAEGSAVKVNDREYKDGPNFNVRKEERDQVLYAIRNGGFSSGPMPQNIATGEEAEALAEFVSKYSGRDAPRQRSP